MQTRFLAAIIAGAVFAAPTAASAFCGFYVAGADAQLYNNATLVVMMRDGTRTVLSMQNNYDGPPENFAMVVPVPVVLREHMVKTLPAEVFTRVDRLSAPRLVEYWEQDPCDPYRAERYMDSSAEFDDDDDDEEAGGDEDLGVKVEAQFTVGEYQIVILSAHDSTGLDTWLRRENYRIPAGAQPLLQPYVASGMKFFVAKVDIAKVVRRSGRVMLSPLRFHYDSQQFSLPVRLGLVNSAGTQDLLVHILSPQKRYELANYNNVTIPTNLDVSDATRRSFGAFYAALFDATLERHPGAVVTEYAWDAGTCDPCPTPPLTASDLATLGADVIRSGRSFVLTRLHARYSKDALGEDLVFREAKPIAGGREVRRGEQIERGARPESYNNFQARYIIRHAWTGPIACATPQRGVWGGPPGTGGSPGAQPAQEIAFAPRNGAPLGPFLKHDVTTGDYWISDPNSGTEGQPSNIDVVIVAGQGRSRIRRRGRRGGGGGCASCASGGSLGSPGTTGVLLGFALLFGLRSRRSTSQRC